MRSNLVSLLYCREQLIATGNNVSSRTKQLCFDENAITFSVAVGQNFCCTCQLICNFFIFQGVDVLNGIAWDSDNNRIFGKLGLSSLCSPRRNYHHIAFVRACNFDVNIHINPQIFAVTGKLWPKLYEIKLRPIKNRLNAGVIEQMCLREPVHFFKP